MKNNKERGRRYKLSELDPGDRFYFAGDKQKTVYELNTIEPFFWKKQAGFNIHYANCRNITSPGKLQVEAHKSFRFVIFLRNVNTTV